MKRRHFRMTRSN